MTRQIESVFKPTPPQRRFLESDAFIRAYGGALGGGKSRAMCEAIFDYCLDYPGLKAVVARDRHTSIVKTTRVTMIEQVVPPGVGTNHIIAHMKSSGGDDYLRFFNGSEVHFIGMDNPYDWYSAEIGIFALDEAQEIPNGEEQKVLRLIMRCRQRCGACVRGGLAECPHFPHKAMMSFNPSTPNHWLKKWFIDDAMRTEYGYRKDSLILPEADDPIGSAEFIFALPTDNPYLSQGYIGTLQALPAHLKRRYLEGRWEFIEGKSYFDQDALLFYEDVARVTKPILQGSSVGDVELDSRFRRNRAGKSPDRIRMKAGKGGWMVWRKPHPEHRYVVGVDVSSGGAHDKSAIQVVDVDAFEQVAEWQGLEEPANVAIEAYRIGRIFNNALIAPEVTGGWGFAVEQELKRLKYRPLYTESILSRITKQWTDRTGWRTTESSRSLMLETLERVVREREFGMFSHRAVGEMATFVYTEKRNSDLLGRPEAQKGERDDLVFALAIAVTVALSRPQPPKSKPSPLVGLGESRGSGRSRRRGVVNDDIVWK